MSTFADLRLRILRILGDEEGAGYTDNLLLDAIGAALDAILPWVPKTATYAIVGDNTAVTFVLPDHLYEIEGVVDYDGLVIPSAVISPGQYMGENSRNTNDWLEYPSGSIRFSNAPTTDEGLTVFYLAHWTKPTSTSDYNNTIEPPERAETGICLYAAAYALLPEAVGAGQVRQFGTKVDSGTPEQNPVQKTSIYLLELFQREMNRHPKHQKAAK